MKRYKNHETPLQGRTVEYYTPKFIFDALNTTFDLDPASPVDVKTFVPADKKYTVFEDGLKQDWQGFVFMNPPYGVVANRLWMRKFMNHNNGIALVSSRTDTLWFHQYAAQADAIIFIKGRIGFIDGTASVTGVAAFGSILVGYGIKAKTVLKDASGKLGFLYLKQSGLVK